MMKERQIGGKILKSAIAILLAAAVAVLTLPGLKMNVWAVAYPDDVYVVEGGEHTALVFKLSDGNPMQSGASIPAGNKVFVPNLGDQFTATVSGLSGGQAVNDQYYDWQSGTMYTLSQAATFTISGQSVTFALSGSTSSAETPAAPGASVVDPEKAAKDLAEFQAQLDAQNDRLTRQRQAVEIYKDKLLQFQRDSEYFRNINEARARGTNRRVDPNTHAVTGSNVDGSYYAQYKNGLAVTADNPSNLHIQTWDISENKSHMAYNSINGMVEKLEGTLVGALQVNIGVKDGQGNINYNSENENAVANVQFGVPDPNGEYVIVKVVGGGQITEFKNLTVQDGVITMELPIGQAAYAVIRVK